MAEKKLDELDKVNEALSTSEQFLEKYQKPILIGLLVVVLAVSGVLAFRQFYLIPRAEKAQAEMYQAVMALEEGNYDLAVAGDENFLGLEAIADQYGSTEAGNLAKAYLGICYFNKADYATAQKYFDRFKATDEVIAPAVLARIGDCLVNMEQYEKSVSYFEKAAKSADNATFSPVYLLKAGLAYEKLGKNAQAKAVYEQIKDNYPTTTSVRGIDRYIERVSK
mgnify:FL=1